MAAQTRVSQGVLNKLRGSLSFNDLPELNVTSPFLGKNGITFTMEGDITTDIPTLTGIAKSPEPYVQVSIVCDLNRATSLANDFQSRLQLNSILGDGVFKSDTSNFQTLQLSNISIMRVGELGVNSANVAYGVTFSGTLYINDFLLNLT